MARQTVFVFFAALCLGFWGADCKPARGPSAPGGPGTGPALTPAPLAMAAKATFAAFRSRPIRQAAMHYPVKEIAAAPRVPMSLTASDGTGLNLAELRAKAVVEGPLAFTELQLSFYNPENRVREGRFEITLPPGAAISRFAMKLPSGWQEAEVVERQRARRIYEDFLHRKQDPALLEKKAGNQFRARIFPIPAKAVKEIIISYSQKLGSARDPYRLYLKGLPKMDLLEITAFVGQQVTGRAKSSLGGVTLSRKVVRVRKRNFKPDRDFSVRQESSIHGLGSGDLAVMRVAPRISTAKAAMDSLLVLVDSSASRASGFYPQVRRLGEVIRQLKEIYGSKVQLQVICFDQVVGRVFEGPIGRFSQKHLRLILARRPLGASDLHGALSWASGVRGYKRVLLVTDGIATAGNTDGAAVREAVKKLRSHVRRLDVMLVGGIRDDAGMKRLATGTLERDGVVVEASLPASQIARKFSHQTLSNIKVAVEGAKWSWPNRLDGMQPGDQALVFVQRKAGTRRRSTMHVSLTGPITQSHRARLASVKRPLLQRAWVEARIAHLEHQRDSGNLGPDLRQAVVKQIIGLSIKNRVLSDYTALLVLESENDYARYGIQRKALADILVVGATGVEVRQRRAPVVRIVRPPVRPVVRPTKSPPRRRRRRRGDPVESLLSGAKAKKSVSAPSTGRRMREMRQRPVLRPPAAPAPAERPAPAPSSQPVRRRVMDSDEDGIPDRADRAAAIPKGPPPLKGKIAKIISMTRTGRVEQAVVAALRWRVKEPGNVMALVALGLALQAAGNVQLAARVYGSIIDLFPSRADMRRFAANRLEALGRFGLRLAADSYRKAAKQRPDHASGHRMLAYALVRIGKLDEALAVLEKAAKRNYPRAKGGVIQILREDAGLVAAALSARFPKRRSEIEARLRKLNITIPDKPSLRFVITWETDANDVDFHIHDGKGGHAYYRNKNLVSGGSLYADVTNGYGPECFTIHGNPKAFPYRVRIHYYSRGPMGYGMGKLSILQHDGRGGLKFENRPFVVMVDRAYVDLGLIKGPF